MVMVWNIIDLMPTNTNLISPITNLCQSCLHRKFAFTVSRNSESQEEEATIYSCSKFDSPIEGGFKLLVISQVESISQPEGVIESITSQISDCSEYSGAHVLEITNVSYDAGTTTLSIDYDVSHSNATDNMLVYISSEQNNIGTVAAVANGSGTFNYIAPLTDGQYSVWLEIYNKDTNSYRYFFSLTTT